MLRSENPVDKRFINLFKVRKALQDGGEINFGEALQEIEVEHKSIPEVFNQLITEREERVIKIEPELTVLLQESQL